MVSDGFDAMAVIVSCGPTWVLLRLLNATTCVGLCAPDRIRTRAGMAQNDGTGDSLGIARDDPQRRRCVDTPIEQEPALVIRNVPPLRRMVLFPAGDVDDHLQVVEEDRTEWTGTVGDDFGRAQDSRFVRKVLAREESDRWMCGNACVGKTYLGDSPGEALGRKLVFVRIEQLVRRL